jgi:hypothetical protein
MATNIDISKINQYCIIGAKDKDWYTQCKESLQAQLPGKDINLVIDIMAATSINSSLKTNIVQFIKMLYVIENKLQFPSLMPNMRMQLEYVRDGKPLTGRKIFNFSEAMKGNAEAVVVDIWILRAFDVDKKYKFKNTGKMKSRGAPPKIYDAIESYFRTEAPKQNLEPRQMCAMCWSGIRTASTSKGNTTTYADFLKVKLNTLFPLI